MGGGRRAGRGRALLGLIVLQDGDDLVDFYGLFADSDVLSDPDLDPLIGEAAR